MSNLNIQEVLAENKKLQIENEKLKKTSEGVHVISQAFAESRREGEKLKGTIRILTHQLSSASSASLGSTNSIQTHNTQTTTEQEITISDDTLLGLAGQLGSNWRSLAFRLDIQTDEVDQVQEHYKSPKEQIYQILRLWRLKQVSSADVRAKLVSALERTGRRDLAEMLQKDPSERVTLASNCDLPWFVDIVSLECRGENEWRKIGLELGLIGDEISSINKLPATERVYGIMDNWLKGLKTNVNPIQQLMVALKVSGRPDVADKLLEASKARNEYVEEWSMQQKETSVRVDSNPKSITSPGDTLHDVPSLENFSIQPVDVDKQESVRSFGIRESMDLGPEPESTGPKSEHEQQPASLSLQLKDIERICRTQYGSSELTNGLAKMLPKSVEQDKELKQLRTLRHATIDQNQRLKDEIEEKNQLISDLRMETKLLKKELEETKKVKQDENLRSFEVITKGDANVLRKEEKLNVEMKQGAGASDVKPQDNTTPVIANLRRENLGLKKQVDEILKVNNEWDQHYAGMKGSYEARLKKVEEDKQKVKEDLDRKLNESLQRQAADHQKESILDKKQREFDQMLTQAKARIDTVEQEKNEHQQRSTRLEKWVHMLLTQKTANEDEIGRLNQELEMSLQAPLEFEMPRGAPAAAAAYGMQIPRDDDVEQRMQEQVDLLQQQNMAFQSDFNQERRDRQHVAGKLVEAQEELGNLRKIARDLQEQVNFYETDRDRKVKRPPGYKSYYIQELPARGKMIRRGVNYGGNDMYIDGDIETDGVDGDSILPDSDSECPMCQRVINDKKDLERHVERCTNNFD